MMKKGTLVMCRGKWSGQYGKIGIITKAQNYPFLFYNVKFRNSKVLEFHKGELKRYVR